MGEMRWSKPSASQFSEQFSTDSRPRRCVMQLPSWEQMDRLYSRPAALRATSKEWWADAAQGSKGHCCKFDAATSVAGGRIW